MDPAWEGVAERHTLLAQGGCLPHLSLGETAHKVWQSAEKELRRSGAPSAFAMLSGNARTRVERLVRGLSSLHQLAWCSVAGFLGYVNCFV